MIAACYELNKYIYTYTGIGILIIILIQCMTVINMNSIEE